MSWVNELIDLYEINSDKIGVIEYRRDMPYVLLPPFHTTVTAQITVTIDQDGNFINAELVDLNDKLTIIPVTEKSGSRTAGKEPHPLCDNLRYLAGDYTKYYKDDGICHELYISQLKEWVESEYCHEKVRAIYLYLKKNTLIFDLVEKRIIKLDEQNRIDDKENIQGIVQTKAFVRFIIRSSDLDLFEVKTDSVWHGCEELKAQMGNKKNANRDACAAIACREWLDVRAFGQVFAFKGIPVSFGVRGPVSIHQAISLSPIDIISMQITKSVNSESGKESKASDTMGTKHRVGFAVYKVMGSVNVQLAEKTGFSQEDAELLKEALKTLFENDASSARPEGSMEVCKMYWWQHDEKTPAVSSGKIQRGFEIKPKKEHPREFTDYEISWHVDGCKEPEEFDFV